MVEPTAGLIAVIVVLGALQLGLLVWALIDIVRRPQTSALPRWAWVIVVLVFGTLGPIVYLMIGRRPPLVAQDWRGPQSHEAPATPQDSSSSLPTAPPESDSVLDSLYGPHETDP